MQQFQASVAILFWVETLMIVEWFLPVMLCNSFLKFVFRVQVIV